jgi:hypothetical protein
VVGADIVKATADGAGARAGENSSTTAIVEKIRQKR